MIKKALLTALFLIPSQLQAQSTSAEIEERLLDAESRERLELLVELTTLYHEDKASRAVLLGTEALELLRSQPDTELELETLNRLAFAYVVEGDYRRALQLEARALHLARRSNNEAQLALAFRNRGRAYRYLSEYDRALEDYGAAIELYEQLENPPAYGDALNDAGIVYWMKSDFPRALDYLFRAHSVYEETGDRQRIAAILNNIGIVYRKLTQVDKALEYYHQALEIRKEVGPSGSLANVLNNIGNIYLDRNEPNRAQQYFFQALEIGLADQQGHSNTLNNIATAYQSSGDLDHALEYYEKAIELKSGTGEKEGLSYGHLGIARVQRRRGQLDLAISSLKRSIEIAESIDSRANVLPAFLELAEIYAEMGRYREALTAFQKYETLKSEIFNEQNSQAIAEIETRFESDQKQKEIEILRQQQAIDGLELRRQELARRMLLVGLALLLMIILLLFNRYRLKERASRAIEAKNQEILRAQAQLVQSEKMASVGQLVAGVAHEINNPVNFISSGLPSLERDLARMVSLVPLEGRDERFEKIQARLSKLVEAIGEGARRTAEIVRDLSTFSRLDEEMVKTANLHEALESTVTLLHHQTKDRIRIVRNFGDLPSIECYPGQLNQVFMNLLVNAIQAIAGEGTVAIQTARVEGDRVRVSIRDSGPGMARDLQARIFDPFFTTKPVGQGTGLGLFISHGIIDKHGGEIEVLSAPGEGTEFTITLPIRLSGSEEGNPEKGT